MEPARRALLASGLCHFANDAGILVIPGLLPFLRDAFALSYTDVGVLTGVGLAVTTLGQLLFGRAGDAWPARRLLPGGLLVLAAGLALLPLAPGFAALLGAVALARLGASVYHPVGVAWVARAAGGQGLDRAMGRNSSAGNAGVIAALALSGGLAALLGWPRALLAWAGFVALAALAALLVVQGVSHEPPAVRRGDLARELRAIAALLPMAAAGGAAFSVLVTFGPLLATDVVGLPRSLAGLLVAAGIAAGVVSALLYGRLAARAARGRGTVLLAGFLGTALGALLLALGARQRLGVGLALGIFLVTGFSLHLTYPALFASVSARTGAGAAGSAFGVVFAVQLVGGSALSLAAGRAADAWGLAAPFALLALVALAAPLPWLRGTRLARPVVRAPAPQEPAP